MDIHSKHSLEYTEGVTSRGPALSSGGSCLAIRPLRDEAQTGGQIQPEVSGSAEKSCLVLKTTCRGQTHSFKRQRKAHLCRGRVKKKPCDMKGVQRKRGMRQTQHAYNGAVFSSSFLSVCPKTEEGISELQTSTKLNHRVWHIFAGVAGGRLERACVVLLRLNVECEARI